MLSSDKGTGSGSEEFHLQPSKEARELLYYVTDCGVYFCANGYRVEREDYGNYMLLYVTKGTLAVSTGGETCLVTEAEVAFFDCHIHHEYYAKGYVSFYWVHFDGVNSGDFYQKFRSREKGIIYDGSQKDWIRKQISYVVSCCQNGVDFSERQNSMILYSCLCTLLFSDGILSDDREKTENPVDTAKEYIQNHIGEDLSMERIARVAGLSPSHFSRLFKRNTSYSPYDYIILVRMNRAKHLLKTTQKPVKEIAFEVGYNSESHFCNTFTSKIGVSPAHFRKI